jgi:hypothetical protein
MGKKKKGKKKSKEELEAERLVREEEERVAAELEAKRLEEERIAAAAAHKARQEFLTAQRAAELARLRGEQDESARDLAAFTTRLADVEAEAHAEAEWSRYVECSRMPDPQKETELNTFMEEWLTDGVLGLDESLATCVETEVVAKDLSSFTSMAKGRGEQKKADTFAYYADKLRDAELKKIDYVTSKLLADAAKYTNEKNECKISAAAQTLKFGLWVNVALKPFRLKVVDFSGTGIVVDIPKPLALHSVAVRIVHHPANHVSGIGKATGTDVPVGGVLHMDMLEMPPSVRQVKGWAMRQVTDLSADVGRMLYPPGATDASASSNAPPLRVKCVVPKSVVVPSELKMGWWDKASGKWVEEGVSEPTFDEETRLLSFHTTQLCSIAMIQPRHIDLPISNWWIRPRAQNVATFCVKGGRFEVKIEIEGGNCTLRSPSRSEFDHLLGVPFSGPGRLFEALKECGINLCPSDEDAVNCSLPSAAGTPIQMKNASLEELVERDVCTLACAFAISGSNFNQAQGADRCVFKIQETEFDDGAGAEEGEQADGGEWKTVLYTVDSKLDELEVEVNEPELISGVKCLFVKGSEDGDESGDFDDTPEPSAETHAYLKYCLAGKCTPDAMENMASATPVFTQTVRSLLHLTRAFSFS